MSEEKTMEDTLREAHTTYDALALKEAERSGITSPAHFSPITNDAPELAHAVNEARIRVLEQRVQWLLDTFARGGVGQSPDVPGSELRRAGSEHA